MNKSTVKRFSILFLLETLLEGTFSQQYFRIKPQDTSVVAGRTAELHCHVGNRVGLVQWSKDGFLLGYDPDIPGYSRYEMQVDSTQSEYTLLVNNAELTDEGLFQCQVGPGKNEKPIMAVAHLTVLVPPQSLQINGLPDGSDVNIREGEKVVLRCEATSSKPATILKWYRKNVELMPEASKISVQRAGEKLYTTVSTITLYPKGDSSGVQYTCEALQPALDSTLKTTVSVKVLHPTSPPIIEGYNEGDFLQAGDTLTLTCLSTGGKPPPMLTWHRNSQKIEGTYYAVGREAANTVVVQVKWMDNNALFTCAADHPLSQKPLEANIRLSVIYPPTSLAIYGPTEARRGDVVNMQCVSGLSNPAAEITWLLDGQSIEASDFSETEKLEGWTTASNVTVTISRQETGIRTFECTATGVPRSQFLTKSQNITIIYPPGTPRIEGNSVNQELLAERQYTFTCSGNSGYPHPDLRWYKGDEKIQAEYRVEDDRVQSSLSLLMKRMDNGKYLRCEVNNSATQDIFRDEVKLAVLFPPKNVTVKIVPLEPKEGNEVNMHCWTDSSNPPSTIIWYKDGNHVQEVERKSTLSSYGGWSTSSRISIWRVQSEDEKAVFTCEAKNEAFAPSVKEDVRIRVRYAPRFDPSSKSLQMTEGQTLVLNATASAYPPVRRYSWSKGHKIIPLMPSEFERRVNSNGPVIRIKKVLREDAGEYVCTAENAEGVGRLKITLDVLYPASILNITGRTEVAAGDDASFECTADGNPLTEKMIYWRRAASKKRLLSTAPRAGMSVLLLLNVSRSDEGPIECWADNGVGESSFNLVRLNVMYSPVILLKRMSLKVAVGLRETAELRCGASAYPDVIFTWSVNGSLLNGGTSEMSKYSLNTSKGGNNEWWSTLRVRDVDHTDIGRYTCVSRNHLGHDHAVISLLRLGPPSAPENLRVFNVTHRSIFLKWTPGFDGGRRQTYIVRYRHTQDSNFSFLSVVSNATTVHIENLSPSSTYEIALSARNVIGESAFTPDIKVQTKSPPSQDQRASFIESQDSSSSLSPWLIAAAILSGLAVVANMLLCALYVRRKRLCQKPMQASTAEVTSVPEESGDEKIKISQEMSGSLLESTSPFYLSGAMVNIPEDVLDLSELQVEWKSGLKQTSHESSEDGHCSLQRCACGTKNWGSKLICGGNCPHRESSSSSPSSSKQHERCPDILKRDSCHCHASAQDESASSVPDGSEGGTGEQSMLIETQPAKLDTDSRTHITLTTFQTKPELHKPTSFIGPKLETVINGYDEDS